MTYFAAGVVRKFPRHKSLNLFHSLREEGLIFRGQTQNSLQVYSRFRTYLLALAYHSSLHNVWFCVQTCYYCKLIIDSDVTRHKALCRSEFLALVTPSQSAPPVGQECDKL
jgi:hypothetical protein